MLLGWWWAGGISGQRGAENCNLSEGAAPRLLVSFYLIWTKPPGLLVNAITRQGDWGLRAGSD